MTVEVELGGVAETLLWTLYQRSVEAARPDAVLRDPLAVELVERIDYPFAERFGSSFGQWQALRARTFDDAIRRFLAAHPDGAVAALGDGLETQLWRVDNGSVRWVSVDLPEVVALRARLLPPHDRRRDVAASAFDFRWPDEVDASRGLLITAQGLQMYAERDDAFGLIAACAERFPGATFVFDAVPAWLSDRSRRGALSAGRDYRPPEWPWGAGARERDALAAIPNVTSVRTLRLPRGRGLAFGAVLPLLALLPFARRLLFVEVFELGF